MTVELVPFQPTSMRAMQMFTALGDSAKRAHVRFESHDRFKGGSDLLLLWGAGAPNRVEPMRQQLEAGGHVVAFDVGYWDRDRKVRLSIDAPHPQAWVMKREWPTERFVKDAVPVSNAWNPAGPVIVAGIGAKSRVQYGEARIAQWEAGMVRECLDMGRTVTYRPKRPVSSIPTGATLAREMTIERVLDGASLLITWHSNVAIDAIRMGIPVVCRDGAAAAVASSIVSPDLEPLATDVRDRFLANLAFFQWSASEASHCWGFLQDLLA